MLKRGFLDKASNVGNASSNSTKRSSPKDGGKAINAHDGAEGGGKSFVTKEELALGFNEVMLSVGRRMADVMDSKLAQVVEDVQAIKAVMNAWEEQKKKLPVLAGGALEGMQSMTETTDSSCYNTSKSGEAAIVGEAASQKSRSVARRQRRKKDIQRHMYHRGQLLLFREHQIPVTLRTTVKARHCEIVPQRPPGLELFECDYSERFDSTLQSDSAGEVEWGQFQSAEWTTSQSSSEPAPNQSAAVWDQLSDSLSVGRSQRQPADWCTLPSIVSSGGVWNKADDLSSKDLALHARRYEASNNEERSTECESGINDDASTVGADSSAFSQAGAMGSRSGDLFRWSTHPMATHFAFDDRGDMCEECRSSVSVVVSFCRKCAQKRDQMKKFRDIAGTGTVKSQGSDLACGSKT